MRVCPACGHEDAECWRNHPRQLYTQYCHIEELELLDPEVHKLLLETLPNPSEVVTMAPFVYRVSRSRHVHRMALKDYQLYGFHGRIFESPRRAYRLAMEGKQKKITDENLTRHTHTFAPSGPSSDSNQCLDTHTGIIVKRHIHTTIYTHDREREKRFYPCLSLTYAVG